MVLRTRPAAIATLLAVVFAIPLAAQAQSLQRSDNPLCDWELRGVIETGLSERFDRLSGDWSPQTLLCLDSPGGNLETGIALFHRLFRADVITVIPPGWRCESACAIAFLAGSVSAGSLEIHSPQRVLYPGGRLGFHAPSLDLPETGQYTSGQVSAAFALAVAGADRIVQLSQEEIHDHTPLNGFMLRRTLGTPPEDMATIDTVIEAALAELQIAGLPGPAQLNAETAENACDLAITLHQQRYRRTGVDLAALLDGLSELRQWRRDTEHAEIRTGTRRVNGQTGAQALVTHYPTDVGRSMLACELTLLPTPDAAVNARHSFEGAPERILGVRLLVHRWGFAYAEDDVFTPTEHADFSVPAWFMHPPETPLVRFTPASDAPVLLFETDLPGADLTSRGIRDVSLDGCVQACREMRGCRAFSYVEDRRWCWPKSQGPAPSFNRNVISGIMPGASWPRD